MNERGRWLVAPLVGVALAASNGCETLIGAQFEVERASCRHATYESPPPQGDYGSGTEVVLGVRAIDFGEDQDAYQSYGFDQDGLCTNKSQGPSCRTPSWPSFSYFTDGNDGIDNATGALIGRQQAVLGGPRFLTASSLNDHIESGTAPPPIVFRITRFDGISEDDQVTVEWFLPGAFLVRSPDPWGGTAEQPSYEIPVDERGVNEKRDARVADEHAYVHNGTLVARFDKASGTAPALRVGNTMFEVESAILTASVPSAGSSFQSAMLAGKVTISQLFASVPHFIAEQGQGTPVCTDSPTYPGVKGYICGFADLRADGQVAPDLPCDALSFGFKLARLSPVVIGPVVSADITEGCTAATSPANDDCTSAPVPFDAAAEVPNCVKPGTPNNDAGVGGPCSTGSDCVPPAVCTADLGAPAGAHFCMRLCATPGEPCGEGVHCVKDSRGTACVPDSCIPPDGGQ